MKEKILKLVIKKAIKNSLKRGSKKKIPLRSIKNIYLSTRRIKKRNKNLKKLGA